MRKLEELGNEEKSFFSVADLPRRHEKNAENRGAKVCLSFCRRNVEEISFRLGGWLKVVYGARSCGGPTRWSTVRLYQDYDPFAVCHAITSHAEYQKVLSSLLFPLKDLQRSFLRKGERRIYLFSSLLEFNCCHFPRAKFRRIANFEFLFCFFFSLRSRIDPPLVSLVNRNGNSDFVNFAQMRENPAVRLLEEEANETFPFLDTRANYYSLANILFHSTPRS